MSTKAKLINALQAAGQELADQDTFIFEGSKNVGPKEFAKRNPATYARYVGEWAEAQEEETNFDEFFDALFDDGCFAVAQVASTVCGGFVGKATMFEKPNMRQIQIDVDEFAMVPTGTISLSAIQCQLALHNAGGKLVIRATTTKANEPIVRAFLKLVREYLRDNSIYKGKSLTLTKEGLRFNDIATIDPESVFYSDTVMMALKANVFTMIDRPKDVQKLGLSLKSNVLLHGPFGSGKSLAGILTMQCAVKNGVTFINVPHDVELAEAHRLAVLFARSVLFIEDIDTRISDNATESAQLMEILDGSSSKGKSVITIMTTNHPERIQAGQWRKGRIDEQIRIAELSDDKMQALTSYLLGDLNSVDDWQPVLDSMRGLMPAYVASIVRSAQLYALANERKSITEVELVAACVQAREQFEMQSAAKEYQHSAVSIDSLLSAKIESALESVNEWIENQ